MRGQIPHLAALEDHPAGAAGLGPVRHPHPLAHPPLQPLDHHEGRHRPVRIQPPGLDHPAAEHGVGAGQLLGGGAEAHAAARPRQIGQADAEGGDEGQEEAGQAAEQVFNLPVRIGNPAGVGGLVDLVHSPQYATAVGLVLHGASSVQSTRQYGGRKAMGGLFAKAGNWFSEHF